jgi:hypothetical protein
LLFDNLDRNNTGVIPGLAEGQNLESIIPVLPRSLRGQACAAVGIDSGLAADAAIRNDAVLTAP